MRKRITSLVLTLAMLLTLVPALGVTASAAEITTGNATVTAPVGGQTPSFEAVSDEPSKYTVELVRWVDVENGKDIRPSELTNTESTYYNYKFVGGQQYTAVVRFTAAGGNTLSYDNTFTINHQPTYWVSNGLTRTCTFTAAEGSGTPEPEPEPYSAEVADINIQLPAGYGESAIDALGDDRAIKITNTGTQPLAFARPTLSGTNASAFNIQRFATGTTPAGGTDTNYAVQPVTGLVPGTYTATISCTDKDNKLPAPVTATVTLTVGDHNFDTGTWQSSDTHHWNPCTDANCTAHGNEAPHDSDDLRNATSATFDTDGYTGDKYCSVCGIQVEKGTVIAAGKYIRESKATMNIEDVDADHCGNDLVFTSLDTDKYTVALYKIYDMTDGSQNTQDSDSYPKDKKFIEGHKYRIIFKFAPVGSYVYDVNHATHGSTFTLNGAATQMAPFTSLTYSTDRMIEVVAGASDVTSYSVIINPGAYISPRLPATQTVTADTAITPVVFTAYEGYYFPIGYYVAPVNGISVTRNDYTKITVSGTPTAAVAIDIPAPTAKEKEPTPAAVFNATGADSGTLSNVASGMQYSIDKGSSWVNITDTSVTIGSGITRINNIWVKKPAADPNTKLDSDVQTIAVTQWAGVTGVTGVACKTAANNDGKITGTNTTMEYKKSDAASWTDCPGGEITGLANGTYDVRYKASGTKLASETLTVTIAAYDGSATSGTQVSGTVASYGSAGDPVTVSLTKQGETDPAFTQTLTGASGSDPYSQSYSFSAVPAGEYILKVEKKGHAPWTETITVGASDITGHTVTVYLWGDVNQDGRVNNTDALWARQSSAGGRTLDAYQKILADVNKDTRVNNTDALWIRQISAGSRTLTY